MMKYTSVELAEWSGGFWDAEAPEFFDGIGTHSARENCGDLFVALKGLKHDAHDFVKGAADAGYAAAMVRRDYVWPTGAGESLPFLRVGDTLSALGKMAAGYRKTVAPCTIGITGSVGKTTVKEMTVALLRTIGSTAGTLGNYNNEIGLPLSLLAMPRDTKYGVFEIGMSNPGELAPLCDILRPGYGIVTNVGAVHIEAFDSEEAVAIEKAELLRSLPRDGVAILDGDQRWFELLRAAANCEVAVVSEAEGADFMMVPSGPGEGVFHMQEKGGRGMERLLTGVTGKHNLRNAAIAVALARRLGCSWDAIREALPSAARLPMRWEVSDWRGTKIINDAYNANLLSMEAALETFRRMNSRGRKYAVLGDMLELGGLEEAQHRALGRLAFEAGLERVFLVGERVCRWVGEGSREAGASVGWAVTCGDCREAAERLGAVLSEGDAVLLKASRGMALERVVEELKES